MKWSNAEVGIVEGGAVGAVAVVMVAGDGAVRDAVGQTGQVGPLQPVEGIGGVEPLVGLAVAGVDDVAQARRHRQCSRSTRCAMIQSIWDWKMSG